MFTALVDFLLVAHVNVNGKWQMACVYEYYCRSYFFFLVFSFFFIRIQLHLIFIVKLIAIFHNNSKNRFHWAYEYIYNSVCEMTESISNAPIYCVYSYNNLIYVSMRWDEMLPTILLLLLLLFFLFFFIVTCSFWLCFISISIQ